MKTILICMAILVIALPIVIIIGDISGKTFISTDEYLYLVLAFVVTFFLYNRKKPN